jgi:hypothetical protein
MTHSDAVASVSKTSVYETTFKGIMIIVGVEKDLKYIPVQFYSNVI